MNQWKQGEMRHFPFASLHLPQNCVEETFHAENLSRKKSALNRVNAIQGWVHHTRPALNLPPFFSFFLFFFFFSSGTEVVNLLFVQDNSGQVKLSPLFCARLTRRFEAINCTTCVPTRAKRWAASMSRCWAAKRPRSESLANDGSVENIEVMQYQ